MTSLGAMARVGTVRRLRLKSSIAGSATRRAVYIVLAIAVVGLMLSTLAIGGADRPATHAAPATHGLEALPAAARAVVAQQLGAADRRDWARRAGAGAAFSDPRTGIDARVSGRGVVVRAGALSWSLGLRAVGRGARLAPAAAASSVAHANQVTLQHAGGVQERYDYGPLGLEQGFTIGRRPAGPSGDDVVLALGQLPHGVAPIVAAGGQSLSLERHGIDVLRYWGLAASDARGRTIPARITVAGRGLSLHVDDRGARYPLRIDPFVQAAKLTPSDAGSEFGTTIAVAGDTIVAGLPSATIVNNSSQGAVYVFVKPAGGWADGHEVAKLTASDGATNDQLGSSVAISADGATVLAGAPGVNNQQGSAYVFTRPNGGWASEPQAAKLTNSGGAGGDRFGFSVALSNDTAVVGVPFEGNGQRANDGGSVYVFPKPAAGWTDSGAPAARLTGSDVVGDAHVADQVGSSVAIDGDTIVAGAAHQASGPNLQVGALYVFVKPANGWADSSETKKLTASDGASGNALGTSAAISGDTIAAGAPFPSGAAYVFVKPPNGWANAGGHETAKLTPSDPSGGFGESTAISGDTIVAGAPNATVGQTSRQGKLYVFAKPAGGWASGHEAQQLTASDGAQNDQLGFASGISGGTIAGGAPMAGQGAGAVYVFTSSVQAATSTAVACQPATVTVGSATSCTAKVLDAGGATPTGSVAFSSDSSGTFDSGGSCTLVLTGNAGEAACHVGYTPTSVGSGTHTITGSYGGDGGHGPSSGSGSVAVTAGGGGGGGGGGGATRPTSTSLSCSPAAVTNGHATTCGATVSDTGNGPLVTPSGVVRFGSDSPGTFNGASCTLTPLNAASAGCLVHYTPTSLASGTHTLTGAYGGDGVHSGSVGRASVSVITQPVAPVNTALPLIVQDQNCQFFLHRYFCQAIPYQYFCEPGNWVGGSPVTYQFEWQQLYDQQHGRFLTPVWRTEPHGNGQTFYASSHVTPFDIANGYVARGFFRCIVTATGPGGSTTALSLAKHLQVAPPSISVPRPTPVNIVVTGIEVTQAVQSSGCGGCVGLLPSRDQSRVDTPGQATYQGVTLAAGKWTVVRVYAHVAGGTPVSLSGATAQLEVFDSNGNRISTLNPDSSPASLTQPPCNYCVTPAEVANPGSSYNFLVPWEETSHQSLTFRATITPAVGVFKPGLCGGCHGNVFTLSSVPFIPTVTVPIKPLPLAVSSTATNCQTPGTPGCSSTFATGCGAPGASGCTNQTPQQVFGDTSIVMPGQIQIYPFRPLLVVGSGENACQAATDVIARDGSDGITVNQYGVGVFFTGEGAMKNGCTAGGFTLFNNGAASAVQDTGRSMTSVTHEIGHGLGLVHADKGSNCVTYFNPSGQTLTDPSTGGTLQTCPGPHPDTTADCGGASNGQAGETWPPGVPVQNLDNEGRLDSFGLDRRAWDIFTTGSLPSTFVEGFDHVGGAAAGTKYYDLMSYCAPGDSAAWISLFNWNRLLNYHAPANNLPAAADRGWRAVQGAPLRVVAIVDSNGNTSIVHVLPGQRGLGGPTPGSPYRIELRDRSGRVLDSVVPQTGAMHVDHSGQGPELLLDATLPFAPATASVDVSAAGQEVARRVRSAHAPTGRFLSPRPGSQLGKTRTTVVRWSARDADGDRLTSMVEYSLDGGRHWTVVADGITGNSARVPSRFLSASRNARLRVLLDDGFDVTSVTSGRLRSRGAPPTVQILNGPRRGHVLDTTTLLLQGSAFDDAAKAIIGRQLKWYLGKRLIGTGGRVTLSGPKAGNTAIRLVATDSRGRSSQATLPLRVKAVAARYLLFDAPLLVSVRARSVKIRIASSRPATFTIAGKRYTVTQKLRTITVRIRRGKSLIRLSCSLRSAGGVVGGTYVALRGP